MRKVEIWRLGKMRYERALALQQHLHRRRKTGELEHDSLILIQHPPTITLGRFTRPEDAILTPEPELKRLGIDVQPTKRGGQATFHGPGQAVLYPIVSLRALGVGVRKFVTDLEDSMITLVRRYGLQGSSIPCQHGCWIDGRRKVGAVGVSVYSGVTMHGLAFNVNTDLSYFKHIIPCGIVDKEVTSLAKEVGEAVDEAEVREELVRNLVQVFGYEEVAEKEIEIAELESVIDKELAGETGREVISSVSQAD